MRREDASGSHRALRATMTVFLGMTIMLILSIFFSLLEVIHYFSIKKETQLLTDIGTESMFADYCRPLWKKYEILGIDGGYGGSSLDLSMTEGRLADYLLENVSLEEGMKGSHHLMLGTEECKVDSYGLLTDGGGAPFMKECAKAALYGIPDGIIDALQGHSREMQGKDYHWEDSLGEGQEAYEEALREKERIEEQRREEARARAEAGIEGDYSEPEEVWTETALTKEEAISAGNPISMVYEFKNNGILRQVLPEGAISRRKLLADPPVSRRRLASGNLGKTPSISVTDKALFEYYLMEHFGSYTEPKKRKGLQYELEYVVGKDDSDDANLEKTIEKLLVYRGAMNLPVLMSDPRRMGEAHAVAVALAGASLNPALVEIVYAGIVAAWVYIESVMDVRALLAGDKIAITKSHAQWTSEILALPACLSVNARAMPSTQGVDYRGCLVAMLTITSKEEAGMRAMDLIENEIRLHNGYRDVRLDNFIYAAKLHYRYLGVPIFGSLVSVGQPMDQYRFEQDKSMSYLE